MRYRYPILGAESDMAREPLDRYHDKLEKCDEGTRVGILCSQLLESERIAASKS